MRLPFSPVDDKPRVAPPGPAVRAVLALRKALLKAADAVVPPELAIFERVVAAGGSQVIAELARLGVADVLTDGPMTGAEIAERTGTNADAMHRTMRGAVAMGVFDRRRDGRFANNRLSKSLRQREGAGMRAFAVYFGSKSNMRAWSDFGETLRTGASAFERVNGTDVWTWFDRHPDERETFAQAMMTLTLLDAPGIASTYPFAEVSSVCDVGGGRGALLSEILLHHPHLRGTLCDAPSVLESAKPLLARRGVAERVTLVPGSFFESVPAGADAYLLKNILHDWDDDRALRILERCRAAMQPGRKVLVIEAVVEADSEDFGAFSDLQMMVVCSGGRERSRAEFEKLFRRGGFRLERVLEAPTPVAILEAIAV